MINLRAGVSQLLKINAAINGPTNVRVWQVWSGN
jgi:hypothetical protein